jgi:phytoene dehydrogenase-like protein
MEYGHEDTSVRLYRDVNKTERHLLELSPEDAKEIKRLCDNIRKMQNLSMPVTDVKGVKVTKKNRLPLSLLLSAISAMRVMGSLSRISRDEYIGRFRHEGIKNMLRSCTTEKNGVLPVVFTMGTLARGDGGFPEGGSLPFAGRIAEKFKSLSGELLLGTRADKVIVENGKAAGVMTGDKRLDADAVIVTADTMMMDHLFDTPPKSDWLDEMRKTAEPTMCTFICLGVGADLKKYNKGYIIKAPQPIELANETYEYLSISNYAGDPVYSPEGKSAITVQLGGDTYGYWKKAKDEGRYAEEKQRIADDIIAALATGMPETQGKVEVIDVATPLTYERYCANWKGSWMTEILPGMKMKTYPADIKGLTGVYFAGHRMMPPGGLPVALTSARDAVQCLCRDTGTVFVSE